MAETTPLLTIAIPTFNRHAYLAQLLAMLAAQNFDSHSEVEVLVSDNASADETQATVAAVIAAGSMQIRYHRHPENIGSDANFVFCYHAARGRYFWLCGDDDLILPGAVERLLTHLRTGDFDLIYATSYGFQKDWQAERQGDPLRRRFHTITSARTFAKVVNIMFTFISGIIVNKQRLESLPHEDPSTFLNTNLTQLSWTLPLLRHHRRSLVLWDRPVAARQGNAAGYKLGKVFGENLDATITRCLPDRPDLAAIIRNFAVRRWFPSIVYDLRRSKNSRMGLEEAATTLRQIYGNNLRYWLFMRPVFSLPLPLARLWFKTGAVISKLIYIATVPGFWRRQT